jgi:ribosomal protein S18 acetylase RimI-like enzyme
MPYHAASTATSGIRLSDVDLDWLTDLLADAFSSDPLFQILFSEPNTASQLHYFMRCNSALALRNGECYATEARDGVALWLPPGRADITVADMWRAGMLWAPLKYGVAGTTRLIKFARHIHLMHQRCAPMPHYYLFLTGVRPARQRQGVSAALLGDMLARIDEQQLPAYLETQNADNIEIYQKLGFSVVEKQAFPGMAEMFNWGMLRQARQ